jgi:hypothetical protein
MPAGCQQLWGSSARYQGYLSQKQAQKQAQKQPRKQPQKQPQKLGSGDCDWYPVEHGIAREWVNLLCVGEDIGIHPSVSGSDRH